MRRPLAWRLNRRVELLRPERQSDGAGGFVSNFVPYATVWAEVQGMDGRESVIDQVLQGISTYRIRLRFRSDVKASDQLRFAGTLLNITTPPADPDGRRRELVLIASTLGVQG